jgi:regulator of sigma E protease
MLSWLAPILVLGMLIFVHELGHFLAAKWAGVYAPRFSLGWGSPLWSFRRGETEYAISWLPIGGYVRMASKEDETASALEGGGEGEGAERSKHWDEDSMIPHGPKPIPADRWFESKPLYKRLVIMLAGVFMNAVLAVVVAIGLIAAKGVPQAVEGPFVPVVGQLVRGMPADVAGLKARDTILAIDGVAVTRWDSVQARIGASEGRALAFEVSRRGERRTISITPEIVDVPTDSTGTATRKAPRIGMVPLVPTRMERVPFGRAVVIGWDVTWANAGQVLFVLNGLFRGNVSITELGGPIEIARSSVTAAREGLDRVWELIALLSINLAILNLLPIPLLDGGQIVLQLVEAAWRRPLPVMVKEWYARVGLVAILLLFVTVTFNDLKRIILGWLGG